MTIAPDVWVLATGFVLGYFTRPFAKAIRTLFPRRRWDWSAEHIKNQED